MTSSPFYQIINCKNRKYTQWSQMISDSFTNDPFTNGPHSSMPPFTNDPIHQWPHSTNAHLINAPSSPVTYSSMTPFQPIILLQLMTPFTNNSSTNDSIQSITLFTNAPFTNETIEQYPHLINADNSTITYWANYPSSAITPTPFTND